MVTCEESMKKGYLKNFGMVSPWKKKKKKGKLRNSWMQDVPRGIREMGMVGREEWIRNSYNNPIEVQGLPIDCWPRVNLSADRGVRLSRQFRGDKLFNKKKFSS